MTQSGKTKLRGRRGSRALQFLDVGRDVNALDVRELRHAFGREPIEKLRRRARIGPARVRVADVGGEEFEEALGSVVAEVGDDGRDGEGGGSWPGDGPDVLTIIHDCHLGSGW